MDFSARYGPWALISGASAGLGVQYAHQLAALGLDLLLVARRQERLEALAAELRAKHAVEVICCPLDLTAPDAIGQLQADLGQRELGLVIANAGFGHKGPFLEGDAAWDQQMIQLNCAVPVAMAHAFLPPMLARGRGGLVVVASAAAYQATPFMSVYGASKAFDLLWAEGLSEELRGSGVDVFALSPGTTDTEFHQVAGGLATFGRMAGPAEVVRLSLQRLPRGGSAVHGWRNRCLTFLTRFAPRRLVTKVSARMIRSHRPPPTEASQT